MDYLKVGWPPKLIQNWLNLTDRQMLDVTVRIFTILISTTPPHNFFQQKPEFLERALEEERLF
jgi:hypothetical protein